MKPPAQRTGYRLCLEMVVECSSIAPYIIATNLDQACAKHDAEDQPAKQSDDRHRWCALGKRAHVEEGTKEDCKKSGFEYLNFPAISIPVLPDMNERHIEKPKNNKQQRIREACQYNT